ncbi:hypothetical protein, partial [Campylobacter jejuni]
LGKRAKKDIKNNIQLTWDDFE